MFPDNILLSVAQQFCDSTQRLTGLTKFWFEKWTLITSVASFSLFAVENMFIDLILVSALLAFAAIYAVRETEKAEIEFLAKGRLRRHVSHFLEARLSLFVVCAFDIFTGLMHFGWTFPCFGMSAIAWIYFSACIPRPPSKSKMREWAEKSLMFLRDQFPPALVPVSDK